MKMIFKNLWNRRRGNLWLFIELVLVAVLSWVIVDPVAVSVADTSQPLGYDVDRLVIASFGSLPADAPGYDSRYDSIDDNRRAVDAVMAKIRNNPDVEQACNLMGFNPIGSTTISNEQLFTGNDVMDVMPINVVDYPLDEHFFETFGIGTAEGSLSPEELSRRPRGADPEVIISKEVGEIYWPGESAIGKRFLYKVNEETGDTLWRRVVAVADGVRWQSMIRSACVSYRTVNDKDNHFPLRTYNVVIRLRDGIDKADFINGLLASAQSDFRVGNFYLNTVGAYDELLFKTEDSNGVHAGRMLNYVLAFFFFINLVLGTVGCFWLQTRKRVEEIGVRHSFGARRGRIVGMLVAESLTLATVAFIIGDLIYLQWALKYGLDNGADNNSMYFEVHNWVSSFPEHFIIVSAIVYAVIMLSVVAGTLIPAINASRVNVTDALRDE